MLTIFDYPNIKIPSSLLIKSLEKSCKRFFKLEPISIIFVSTQEIKRLNFEYRKIDQVTDVLSFNFDTKELLGEVYICKEYIDENTKPNRRDEELVRLTIHGILHLYGYDHMNEFVNKTDVDLENMFVIQESILDKVMEEIK